MVPMFDAFCFNEGACRVIGEIITFAGSVSPDPVRWLECDGQSVLRADYPDLFTVIGTTYGSVDSTHFNLPDFQGRAATGAGSGAGIDPHAVGDSYGEQDHVLTVAELATHAHSDIGHIHGEVTAVPTIAAAITGVPVPSAIPGVGFTGSASANITNTGSNSPHNTVGPRLTILYLIVALS